jgi:hypothetical protein
MVTISLCTQYSSSLQCTFRYQESYNLEVQKCTDILSVGGGGVGLRVKNRNTMDYIKNNTV